MLLSQRWTIDCNTKRTKAFGVLQLWLYLENLLEDVHSEADIMCVCLCVFKLSLTWIRTPPLETIDHTTELIVHEARTIYWAVDVPLGVFWFRQNKWILFWLCSWWSSELHRVRYMAGCTSAGWGGEHSVTTTHPKMEDGTFLFLSLARSFKRGSLITRHRYWGYEKHIWDHFRFNVYFNTHII